jgi:hypothetical protein
VFDLSKGRLHRMQQEISQMHMVIETQIQESKALLSKQIRDIHIDTTNLRLNIERETEGRDAKDQIHTRLISELD